MFHYMIRKLPNGKLMLRDVEANEITIHTAGNLISTIESLLEPELQDESKQKDIAESVREAAKESK